MLHQWQRKKSEFLLRDTSHGMIGYGHNQHDSYMISKTRCSTKSWRDARFNPTSHTFCRFADRKFNRNQSHIGALRDHCLPWWPKGASQVECGTLSLTWPSVDLFRVSSERRWLFYYPNYETPVNTDLSRSMPSVVVHGGLSLHPPAVLN